MRKILIIDDDSSLRSLMATALRGNGFDIIEAADGAEGFSLARQHLPDLVLSDVNMEGLDGYGFLQQLRAQTATSAIPVILMTGASENDMRQSMEKGADDYLPKPFNPGTLIAAVKTRLNRKEEIDHQMRAVQERLLAIVSSTPNLIAILDHETGHAVHLNPAGRAMLGLKPDEDVTQLNFKQRVSFGKTGEDFETCVQHAESQGRWTGECRLAGRQNKILPVDLQLLAHRSEDGSIAWLSIIASDLSATLQLRQAQKMEAIGRLAAGVAHEINTPTQYVGDNTQFLKNSFQSVAKVIEAHRAVFQAARNGQVTGELINRVEQIETESDLGYLLEQIPCAIEETLEGIGRVTKIVRAMKEFSHPGTIEKCPTNINKAIETTVTVARNEWKYVSDVKLDLDPQLPMVPCFASEFNQAVLNLVVNAAHAIGDAIKNQPGTKGTITVSTRRSGTNAEIRVSDTGAGIPESVRSRIFEPFFTTKPVGKGTGQGLSFVYSTVVTNHEGHVSFETESGKGTTFILRLPLAPRPLEK
ncbi:MAG TPA: response regulator [Verrucomicrobiae bacterium]|jgi:signal transduction histidine kinase/CheY-like chemotaxis protein|nr:response regulator [Verrucomicrobiae bacterium]